MKRHGRELTATQFIIFCSPDEEDPMEGPPPIRAINQWLASQRGLPQTEVAQLIRINRYYGGRHPSFAMGASPVPLLGLLQTVASQAWRKPGAVQLAVKNDAEPCFRMLDGVKHVVSARLSAAAGGAEWWRVSGDSQEGG